MMLDRLRIFRRVKDMEGHFAREIPEHLQGYIAAHDARLDALEDEMKAFIEAYVKQEKKKLKMEQVRNLLEGQREATGE